MIPSSLHFSLRVLDSERYAQEKIASIDERVETIEHKLEKFITLNAAYQERTRVVEGDGRKGERGGGDPRKEEQGL